MDFRERFADPEELQRLSLLSHQSVVWTALPGIVVSFNPSACTCVVQPAIQLEIANPDGSTRHEKPAVLGDVPVCFPRGGGFALTFPLAAGDEVLLIFSSRCIDAWWSQGGVQPANHPRMNSLSDAFAVPGPFSQATVPGGSPASPLHLEQHAARPGVHPNALQLRTLSGGASVTLEASAVTVTAPVTTVSGNLSVGAGATGTFTAGSGETVTVADGIITNIY